MPAFSAAIVSSLEKLVVEPQLGDAADCRDRDDIGRIQPPAQAHLDNAGVGFDAGEGEEGGGGGRLEEAGADAFGGVEHFGEQLRQELVLDELALEAYAFVEADEVGTRIDMGLEPGGLNRGAEESAGRALAVGSGDVEDGREPALRVAEAGEEGADPLEPESVRAR